VDNFYFSKKWRDRKLKKNFLKKLKNKKTI